MLRWTRHCVPGVLLLALVALAQLAVPPLTGHVTDHTGTLNAEQRGALERKLSAFETSKGTQLAVLLVPTTQPEAIEQYALRVAEVWKLGRKNVDDGLILVVAKNDRSVRIEVGYGLEGAMSDITSKRIISETLLPRLREGDFFEGIDASLDQIIRVVNGEPLPAPAAATAFNGEGLRQYAPLLLILVLAVGGVLRSAMGRPLGAVVTGVVVSVVAWFLIGTLVMALLAGAAAMLVTLVGGALTRGPGGLLGGGRGGFGAGMGGSGGGGFRGGGGGFGGGGASGRW
jgi:uncharacterized protein